MRNSKLFSTALCFLAMVSTPANSAVIESEQSDNKKTSFNIFDTQIFSLSKKKENSFDAPSATYILTSEEIRRSGATSIPESLRLVPGLQVARIDGNKWAISARGFNGQFSNKLLVMIDGRTIYTPVFSGVLWDIQDYVLEDIDRIEVVRGPGGTIWGANAVNGVINIITKSAVQTQGSYVSQIIGNQDRSISEVRYGGKTASQDAYRLYAKKAVRDGLEKKGGSMTHNDGNTQNRAGFKYDITSIKDSTISLHGDTYEGRAQNYFSGAPLNYQNDKDSRGGNIAVNWDKRLSKKSNFTLSSYVDYDQFSMPVFRRSAKTYDIDFQHFYDFSSENQFSWGTGYRRINDHIKPTPVSSGLVIFNYNPKSMNSYIYSAFVQDKIGIIADKLYLTVGSKFLKNNFTGFEIQPNAKLAYYPTRNQTVWASVSRAVRTPTRNEDGLNLAGGAQQGNTSYSSETLVAYELGYRIKPSRKVTVDASTFVNQYSSLRTFDTVPTGRSANNNAYGESYGFELSTKWQTTNDLKLEASYDFLKTDIHLNRASTDATGSSSLQMATEGQSPRNQFKIKSFYNITPKLEFDNILYYVSGLPTANAVANPSTGVITTGPGIPSYFRLDTRLGYLVTKNLDLSVGLQDILNQTHTEFKAATFNTPTQMGRTYYFKLAWQY